MNFSERALRHTQENYPFNRVCKMLGRAGLVGLNPDSFAEHNLPEGVSPGRVAEILFKTRTVTLAKLVIPRTEDLMANGMEGLVYDDGNGFVRKLLISSAGLPPHAMQEVLELSRYGQEILTVAIGDIANPTDYSLGWIKLRPFGNIPTVMSSQLKIEEGVDVFSREGLSRVTLSDHLAEQVADLTDGAKWTEDIHNAAIDFLGKYNILITADGQLRLVDTGMIPIGVLEARNPGSGEHFLNLNRRKRGILREAIDPTPAKFGVTIIP